MAETEETLPRATVQKIIKGESIYHLKVVVFCTLFLIDTEILMNPENNPSTKELSCAKETVDVLSSACLGKSIYVQCFCQYRSSLCANRIHQDDFNAIKRDL
jgi:hypothetical protein